MRAVVRSGVIALFATWLLIAQAGPGLGYTYFNPLPRGPVMVRHPDIGVRVQPSPGDSSTSVQLFLDGTSVPVTAAADGWYSYRPLQPLSSGRHTVTALISSAGYDDFRTSSDFVVSGDALESLPAPQPEAQVAHAMVNRLRQPLGLPSLTYDTTLGAAALYHARYDVAHPYDPDPHSERTRASGFTGEDALARAQTFGYGDVGTDEVIDFKLRAEENVADWLSTLYHRLPLVSPSSRAMGYGMAVGDSDPVGVAVMGTHPLTTPSSIAYPADGQTGVPTGWAGREHPDPLRLYPGSSGPLGYTITLSFAPIPRSLTLSSYALRTAAGTPVAIYNFSPENDDQLTDAVALIPMAPLQPSTTYQVDLRGTVDQGKGAKPYHQTWSFTTAKEPWLSVGGKTYSMDGSSSLSQVELTGQGFAQGLQVFLQGIRVPGVTVDSRTKLHFPAPPGFSAGPADLTVATPAGQEETWSRFFDGTEGFSNSGQAVANRVLVGVAGSGSALLLVDGTTLLPASLLEALGFHTVYDVRTGRVLATSSGHELTAVPGRALAMVDGAPLLMGAAPRSRNDALYVPISLVKAGADIAGLPLQVDASGDGPATVTMAGFTDILGHWAQGGIVRLASAKIVSGYGDGTFRPQAALTRAAYLKMVVAAVQLAQDYKAVPWISGMDGHWLQTQGYLAAAASAGILNAGDAPGGQLRPDDPIDRQTMAMWAVRALGLDGLARVMSDGRTQVNNRFLDGDSVSDAAAPYVVLAARQGLITGYAQGAGAVYKPTGGATRAEAVTVVDRLRAKLAS